ncbi:MAG: effector-binding domain-containing protein [Planctomycetota bacterium]|jgi:effector-binding domain-containing protein
MIIRPFHHCLLFFTASLGACIAPFDANPQSVNAGTDGQGIGQWHSFEPDMPVNSAPFQNMNVNWKQRIDQPYVYVDFVGSYTETGRLLPSVHRSMVEQGLKPAGPPFGLFYDDPGKTPMEQLRSRACVPVDERVQTSGSLRFDILPSTTVTYAYVAGAYPEVPRSLPGLFDYMAKSGWVENGPIRETYLIAPDSVTNFDELITEVQIPVTYAN